jgi:hypothetical protein
MGKFTLGCWALLYEQLTVIHRKPKCGGCVLTEEEVDETGGQLEHSPCEFH